MQRLLFQISLKYGEKHCSNAFIFPPMGSFETTLKNGPYASFYSRKTLLNRFVLLPTLLRTFQGNIGFAVLDSWQYVKKKARECV